MRNISEITEKNLTLFCEKGFELQEKLDMPFYKIKVAEEFDVLFKKGVSVSYEDRIVSSCVNEIYSFAYNFILPKKDYIISNVGECEIGLFVNCGKSNRIDYTNVPSKFILGSIRLEGERDNYEVARQDAEEFILETFDGLIASRPVIAVYEGIAREEIIELFEPEGLSMWSGLDYKDSAGVVFRNGGVAYQIQPTVSVMVSETDKTFNKMGRDLILKTFADYADKDNLPEGSYSDCVCWLCLKFIPQLGYKLGQLKIDAAELVPPGQAAAGGMVYDLIKSSTLRVMCKQNELIRNVLSILLMGLKNKRTTYVDSLIFSDSDRVKIRGLVDKLKEKRGR